MFVFCAIRGILEEYLKMKAWRLYAKGDIRLEELESQTVGAACAKIKISSSIISPSDIMQYDGRIGLKSSPLILGRISVGMVTEVGADVSSLARGNRVVINPYEFCHTCANCKSGRLADCEKMLTMGVDDNGSFSDFCVINAAELLSIPDRIKDNEAVYLEHVAMAINTLNKLNIEKGEHIVIVGASTLGIIMAQVAMYYQAVPVLVDTRQERLDLAESLGVYYTVNSVDADPYKKVFSVTGGRLADAVAFVTTSKMSLTRALDYCVKGGRLAMVGWADTKTDLNASLSQAFNKQLTIVGVNNGAKNFASAINMLANKSVDVSKFASREIEFADIKKYLDEAVAFPHKYNKLLIKY